MSSPHLHDIDAVIAAAEVLNRGLSLATVASIRAAIKESPKLVYGDAAAWSFSEALALLRSSDWPSPVTALAITQAVETAHDEAGTDVWSFEAALDLVSNQVWPTTKTEAVLLEELKRAHALASPKALLWRRHLGLDVWLSDDGRWRVALGGAGYELALTLLATFSPPVLATTESLQEAKALAALLTSAIDSAGFDSLRDLVTYWQNAYDAQRLAARDARAALDAVKCEHCGHAITEQPDGTWFASEDSITLCAPNRPHSPSDPDSSPTTDESPSLYKTSIVIWSDYDPAGYSLQELGRDADGGGAIATLDARERTNPDTDPSFNEDAAGFFEYAPKAE